MTYLDTSSFLKLFFNEPESPAVREAVTAEAELCVSSLAQVEARVQLKAAWLGGDCTRPRYRACLKKMDELSGLDPFRFTALPGSVFSTALKQDAEGGRIHLRTLDRPHLAAMEELGITRLMTNDDAQAAAARHCGHTVIVPTTTTA